MVDAWLRRAAEIGRRSRGEGDGWSHATALISWHDFSLNKTTARALVDQSLISLLESFLLELTLVSTVLTVLALLVGASLSCLLLETLEGLLELVVFLLDDLCGVSWWWEASVEGGGSDSTSA